MLFSFSSAPVILSGILCWRYEPGFRFCPLEAWVFQSTKLWFRLKYKVHGIKSNPSSILTISASFMNMLPQKTWRCATFQTKNEQPAWCRWGIHGCWPPLLRHWASLAARCRTSGARTRRGGRRLGLSWELPGTWKGDERCQILMFCKLCLLEFRISWIWFLDFKICYVLGVKNCVHFAHDLLRRTFTRATKYCDARTTIYGGQLASTTLSQIKHNRLKV